MGDAASSRGLAKGCQAGALAPDAFLRLVSGMAGIWSLINTRALSISLAQGAFNFELSWLGLLLIVGALLLWRYLRR
jgi:hypothetical protein